MKGIVTHKVDANGNEEWFLNEKRHREDGPAIIYPSGSKYWFKHGELHRENGPSIEYANGDKEWYKNGECHRENRPAIENANGSKSWYKNGELHREDGPAVDHDCIKVWYEHGVFIKLLYHNKIYYKNDSPCENCIVVMICRDECDIMNKFSMYKQL